ncbi:HNH endonuclease [Motilibacter rhizosphaerae]|uniref:HNH endonuclease n=1 Tax=Motilibacter rhizosphaerae TaxID=598652 RepID=A0A4Q7NGE3_9ACTN|nr:HNH endonuclease [Motilibacter rhizosphaerae]RZS82808.1 HNH endonuclease [Motilibacter rhizosphaerae]
MPRPAPTSGPRQPGRAARLQLAIARDGAVCVWCGRALTGLVEATREHLVPRARGGPSWLENEVPACRRCNRERGHRPVVEWLEECERRGWSPDTGTVERSLSALAAAIGRRGGQRRAAAYVVAQQRRLARRAA